MLVASNIGPNGNPVNTEVGIIQAASSGQTRIPVYFVINHGSYWTVTCGENNTITLSCTYAYDRVTLAML